jgi:hydroxyquinol 1,2-dioxygenase
MAFVTEENLTGLAEKRWGTARPPRLAELMTALVRHLHAFAREVRLTEDEWLTAVEWLAATGRISDDKRQEFILASDVLGLSTLVVQLNNRFAPRATPATVLGPFHIDGSPTVPYAHDMSDDIDGTPLFVTGRVLGLDGTPLPDVVLDVWQADADGTYEAQLPATDEARLRAKYRTRQDGSYCVRTIAPRGYAIPMDGPVGDLIARTAISHFRPAHIHFLVEHPGHDRLVTHLFRQGSRYLDSDVVFGTKDQLVVEFVERPAGTAPDGSRTRTPYLHAEFDFVLQPSAAADGTRP